KYFATVYANLISLINFVPECRLPEFLLQPDDMQDLANLRKDYRRATLDVANVDRDPINQFGKWFEEALNAQVHEPNAMHLATVNAAGRPSGRVVLLK